MWTSTIVRIEIVLVVVLAALCMDPLLNTMRMLIVAFQMLIDMMRMLMFVVFQMLMDMMRMLMFVVEVVTVGMVVCEDWTLCVCRWGCRLW